MSTLPLASTCFSFQFAPARPLFDRTQQGSDMIQVTNVRRVGSSTVTFRKDTSVVSAEGPDTWGSWYNDKYASSLAPNAN